MFKKCPNCQHDWQTLFSFIGDKNVRFIGYQTRFDLARSGLFLFNHFCHTTLAIKLSEFEELSPEQIKEIDFAPHSQGCPGHCADENNLEECKNTDCKGKPVRDLIQRLKELSQFNRLKKSA